ncbi:MAG: hypothetical protein AAB371_00805 [Patescibacteria group bacterium]|mgnify:CR=1 FL=1
MVNKVGKGKRLEKLFRDTLKKCYPSCMTELKPMLRFMPKDFWALFDGLTFFPAKKKYLFWQTKSNKLTPKERAHFWSLAKKFQAPNIQILLIEKQNTGLLMSQNVKNIHLVPMSTTGIKKFLNEILE